MHITCVEDVSRRLLSLAVFELIAVFAVPSELEAEDTGVAAEDLNIPRTSISLLSFFLSPPPKEQLSNNQLTQQIKLFKKLMRKKRSIYSIIRVCYS